MKLEKWDINELKNVRSKYGNNLLILEEFANSDLECARVHGYTCKNAQVCASSLNVSIKRYRMFGIRAICRKGMVFLIRVEE